MLYMYRLTDGVRLNFLFYVRALLGNMKIAGDLLREITTDVNDGVLKRADIKINILSIN